MSEKVSMDLFLRTLLGSKEFTNLAHKDWHLISSLIPGSSPASCETRFHELKQELKVAADIKLVEGFEVTSNVPHSLFRSRQNEQNSSGITLETDQGAKSSRKGDSADASQKVGTKSRASGGSSSAGATSQSNMVIHVCDEAKAIKQDFQCPRSLLVREMKYFAEYLSLEVNRCEDVDISVHCDVQIFDWLMRYVKRDGPKTTPKLEPSNAVSILISSDFLKMETLVQECIEYCAQNLEDIVATPCNMNCIQDRLLTNLCNKFNHNQLENMRDKKDKIRSRLFAKKIEQLFDSKSDYSDSQHNACTLYKCQYCHKLLINPLQSKIRCTGSRLCINSRGEIVYKHARDISWDVNDYVISLIRDLKNWRSVYWHLWGLVNALVCSKCGLTFQVRDLGNCLHHTSRIHVENGSNEGTFACCNLKTPLFNSITGAASMGVGGCCLRDHVIDSTARDSYPKLVQDLLSLRSDICTPVTKSKDCSDTKDVNIFSNEKSLIPKEDSPFEKYCTIVNTPPTAGATATELPPEFLVSTDTETDDEISMSGASDDDNNPSASHAHKTTQEKMARPSRHPGNDDDDQSGTYSKGSSGGQSHKRSHSKKRNGKHGSIIIPSGSATAGGTRKWDQNRSHRWNQDVQRNEDLRRFNEMIYQLARIRTQGAEKKDILPHPGGHFAKLDIQFKQSASSKAGSSAANSGPQVLKQGRAKLGQPGKPF